MGLELFADLPDQQPAAPQTSQQGLFDDLPDQQPGIYRNGEREPPFRAGMYENGRLVKPSGPQPYTGPVPDLALDDAPLRTGGAGVDRLVGSRTGMVDYGLSDARRAELGITQPEDPYDRKRREEAEAAAEVSRMSRIGADMRAAPVESFTPAPSPLFEFQRQRAEAEARLTGQPVQRHAMEPTPEQIAETQALEAQAAQEREIARARAGFDAAQKQQRAVITGQPQTQSPVRSAAESLAASIVAVPAGAADALAIVGEKIAQTTESAEAIRDLNQSVQQYFNGLARPDAAQADDFVAGKVPAGIGSTIGFAVTGLVGKALGLSTTATTALAGALPQAAQEYRNAEAKKASELEKWIAFVGGLGLGASEVLPIANTMERWAQQVPGFRRAFRDTTVSMAEEATQEFGQQMGSNALAKATYDPSRPLTEGVAEGAAVGAITGGALGGAGSFANAAMMRGQAGEGPTGNIDVPVPTLPPLPPELQGAVPEGAVNAEVLLGPDPSMPAPDAAPPAPPQSDPRFALQDILNDPRSADEIRAEMQQDGRLPEPPPPPPPAPPAGDRTDPVRIATPEDVTVAAERTATPTPAQAEAGNYAKRHVKWNGLDITIETEAGQQRTGTAEDGQTWAVTLPAPYGYIKRTTGADGDHLDVYVGPNPQGRIFVVDQIDPETRRFDEHKVMLGFDSQEQAQAYYEAGFSDGRGAQRAGAISEIPADQFKQWSQRSNLRRPLRYEPPISAGLTGEQYGQLRQIIKDGGTPLRPDALATTLGARAADVRSVLQRLASRNEIRMAGDGAFSRIPQRTYPLELLQFLAQRGGLQSKQAREVQDLDKVFLPGFGKIARPTGRTLDEAREAAVEAGYLPEGATVRDLLDAVEWSTRGRKRFAAGDQARVIELDGRRAETDAANETLAALERKFADAVAELGVDPAYAELIEADDLTLDGMSPADALATAIERMAVRSLDYAHDAGWMSDQDWQEFDAAFGIRYREPTAQQDDGGLNAVFDDIENSRPQGDGASAPQGREREGADRGREAGSPQAGEQPREAGESQVERAARIRAALAEPMDAQAGDSDEAVTVTLTDRGPWDFNDTFPMPDVGQLARLEAEGRDFPVNAEQVAATFDESLNDMLIDTLDMRRLRAEIADIQLRGVKATKGKTPKIEIERRQQAIQQAEQRIDDTKATYADLWPDAAVTAMMEELERRVAVQTGQQDRGVDRPSSVAREPAPTVEPGAEGKPQTIIPGAERIGQKEQAERAADKPLRAAKPQREAGGMFDQANTAPQLFDAPQAKAEPQMIGENRYGMPVFESADGSRSYLSNGITMEQGKGLRTDAFMTRAEAEAQLAKDTAGTLEERIERYKVEDKTWAEVVNLLGKDISTADLQRANKLWNRGQPTPAQTRREALETRTPPIEDDRERQRRENVAKAEAAGVPLTAGGKGATNTVFTADAAAAARARLKAKLSGSQLNSGIDPETLKDGITLAGFHIEAGARSFAAYSKAMIEDLGEGIRPYLRSLYESVRYYPGFDAKGMSTAAEIEAADAAPASTEAAETTTSEAEPSTMPLGGAAGALDRMRERGAKAFAEGKPRRVPVEIIEAGAKAADAWSNGWDRANLAEPVPGVTDTASAPLKGIEGAKEQARQRGRADAAAGKPASPPPDLSNIGQREWRAAYDEALPPTRAENAQVAPRAEPRSDRETIAETMRQELLDGASYKTIREARALAEKATGGRITPSTETAKLIDEAVELGVVLAARDIVAEGKSPGETFDRLVDLYSRQPSLNVRTSTSMIEQAYSTPVPLAYVASRLAGITADSTVYEPSAGNGALLIEATPANVVANELNPDRRAALESQGFKVMDRDASAGSTGRAARDRNDGKTFSIVIENPPFGVVKDEDGSSRSFKIDDRYTTNEIDHAIVMRSLTSMSRDGRAVLIIGGPNKMATTQAARSNAYNGKAKREFYLTLYGEYNVVDHFTVSGDLYAKQGAGWPVDVIVIDGRGKSARKVPAAQVPGVVNSWDELRRKLDVTEATGSTEPETLQPVRRDEPRGSGSILGVADRRVAAERPDTGRGDGVASRGGQPASPDRVGERPAAGPAQLESQQRDGAGDARQDGAGVQRRPTVAQQAQPSLFDTDSSAETAPATTSAPQPKPRQAPAPEVPAAADMSKPQVPYRPRSNANPMGTLVPVNMQTTSQDALTALEKRVGNIDEYVARELGYASVDEMAGYFGAEQVDGIALGIDNFARGAGVIIGDQTGIGKGRQVAGILRWALRQGKVPIFVTEKPNLYADMYRDLTDIGVGEMLGRDLSIFMTNSGERVPLDEEGKKLLTSPQAGPHSAAMSKMIEAGKLDGYDMIFTTYSQMQTVKGEETIRQKFLRVMAANNSVMALDEAHNAGGQAAGAIVVKKDGKEPLTRAKFARELVGLTSAALYSSATYAKRPDVMDLYFKTDMALAVDDISKLGDLIQRGGIPMQQIVAAMLSKAGQYVRRERSFEGITYDTPVVEVDTAKYEEFSRNIALIQQFSENFVSEAVKRIDQDLKEEGRSIATDGATGGAGASSTNFTAVMHNIINQLLLSMKAQDAADRAIAALKRGEKPVITLANTNEAFIDEYAEGVGAQVGDAIGIRFNDVLQRYLDRSRTVTIRKPFAKAGDTERLYLSDKQIGALGVRAYEEAKASIAAADFSLLPVSPIDWIRSQIRAAGYSVSEITGRGLTLDYQITKTGAAEMVEPRAILKMRPGSEKSIAGRRQAIAGFNSGKIDVLILNQSGSTGLSLHASERVLNKNRRRMILAQAEGNIDTHMQMLGRVNRTGQVVKPSYDQLVAGVPAEKRPASILAKKMASLNANTTGARDSAVTAKDTPDFMNVYGDMVARMVMIENPDLNARLGDPVNPEAEDNEGAMRKVTGRIPLLPLKEQEQLYDLLEAEYTALIQQMEAAGQNALEAKTLELDARTIGTMQVKDGKNADSPFADAVYFEQVDAKRLGKPMAPAEVVAAIAKAMEVSEPDGTPQQKLTVLAKLGAGEMKDRGTDALRQFAAFREAERQRIKKDDAKAQNDVKLNGIKERWMALAGKLHPGAGIKLKTDEGNFYGIVVATNFSGRAKNPLALSAWRVNVALADPARSFTVPFSQLYTASTRPEKPAAFDIEIESTDSVGSMPLLDAFADMQAERREERIIVTGNILAGYDFVNGQGQIVNFTDSEGRLRQGILMRRGFDAEKFIAKKAVQLRSGRQIQTYLDRVQKSLVTSTDKHVMIRRNLQNGDTLFLIDAARQNGGKYFLNRAVLDAAGRDFVKVSDRMRLEVPPTRAPQVADAIIKAGAVFEVSDNIDIAREIAGKVEFSPAPRGWDVAEPMPKRVFTEKDKIDLAQIVGRVAGVDLSIGFPDEIQIPAGTPAARGWGKEAEAFEAGGYYDWANDVIAVSQNIGGPITAYHEAFHRLQTRALTKTQLDVLAAETERLKDIIRRSPLGRNVEQMSQREIEADAFSLFAMARDRKEVPAGFPARVRMIFEKLYKILRAAVNWMKGRGFQTYEDIFTKAWRGDLADAADNNTGGVGGPLLSLSAPAGAQDTTESRKSLIMQAIGKGQPLDRIMRMPFDIFGALDSDGRWKFGAKLDAEAKRIIVDAKLDPNGRFGWLAGPIENARAGLIDRYGLDEDYQKRERGRANDERAVLARGAEILTDLMERNLTAEESRVLQAMLTGEAVSDGDMGKLAEPIREAIDQLGQEAVSLGLISAESYERNRGTYLHRVYTKDLQDANGLTRWVDRVMTSRRKKIIGDQLKGRGIFLEMTQDRLLRDDPEFAAAKRGRAAKGERFMLIQQVQQQQNVEGGTDEKVVNRIWWPADRPLPARYEGFSDGGVWEVRAVTPSGGVTLWRDYTKAERTKMGEILDARYTIGKTYSLMAHDLANGRFFKDIAENEDWSQAQVPDQPWREAGEYGRFWNDPSIEWVKVPNTDIPDTGGKKRWGALAGRYVRAEIWRDLNETAIAQNPSVWRRLLGIWKLNKTARSPVTHMNNIMSNLMFMDLADIRAQDLARGIQSFIKKDEAFRLARDNGAFGNDMMAVEFKTEILQPLLDEITKQQTVNGASNPWFAKAAAAGKMADLIWEGAKKLDQKMIDAYRIEDEIFRMATFMRRREMGDSPQEAADFARRQFLDYDIKAPWVVAARNTVLPFISYVYRAVPLIAEAIAHRPWKLAKYYAVAYAANALAYAADDGGDEERERASMRKDEQGWLWIGVPRMVRMPWRDANGLPVFLDARRWVPAGDIFDAGQGSSALPLPAPFMPGGPIMLGAEFALNKVGFTGKGITNERTDTWWDSTYKTGDWAWKSLMPNAPWVPGSWSGERIAKAWRGGADAGGNPLSMKEAVSSSFGVKVAGRDVDQGFAMKFYEQRRIERELRDEARLLARQRSRNLISQEVFERELANIVKKRQKVAEDTKKIAEQNRTKQQRETTP